MTEAEKAQISPPTLFISARAVVMIPQPTLAGPPFLSLGSGEGYYRDADGDHHKLLPPDGMEGAQPLLYGDGTWYWVRLSLPALLVEKP